MFKRAICTFFALAILCPPQAARAASEAEVNAVIKSLAPISGQTVSPGFRRGQWREPVELIIENRTIIIDYRYAIDLEVYFPFDSARITPKARGQLEALGEALSSPELQPYRYLLAGHTDAKGSEAYNLDLSVRRARAVRNYLIQSFPIEPARLVVVGWGETRLKDPQHPRAGINRRVEVALIAPPQPVSSAPLVPYVEEQPAATTRIIVPSQPSSVTIKIEQEQKDEQGQDQEPVDATDGEAEAVSELARLPSCPIRVAGDPRDPDADLDDFKPRPGIDCRPDEAIRVGPDGKVIIEW